MLIVFTPQTKRSELRQQITSILDQKGWQRKDLAEVTGMKMTTINSIMNNRQLLLIEQLDVITEALGLAEGYFYSSYLAECCNDKGRIRGNKASEFVYKCMLLGRMEIIDQFLHLLLTDREQNRVHAVLLCIAERLYHSPLRKRALAFYDKIIMQEQKKQEWVALAYYRRFMILRDQALETGKLALLERCITFLPQLPIEHKKEAYMNVISFYDLLEDWEKQAFYAQVLKNLAEITDEFPCIGEAMFYQTVVARETGKHQSMLVRRFCSLISDTGPMRFNLLPTYHNRPTFLRFV